MKNKDLKNYLEDLETIINIESPTSSAEGVNKVADFFVSEAQKIGLQTKRYPVNGYGDCLIISNNINACNYDFAIVGHMDTVYPIGHIKETPFKIDENKIYGPGVIDDKGCILLALYTIKSLDLSGRPFVFILNSTEEIGSIGTKDILIKYGKKCKYALVVEPARANGALVATRKGVLQQKFTFKGVGAHSGNNPDKGRSALAVAAQFITHFAMLNDYEQKHTFNTIVYEGGNALNIIPEKASIGLEMRYMKPSSLEFLENHIQNLIKNPLIDNIKISRQEINYMPPLFDEGDITKNLHKQILEDAKRIGVSNVSFIDAGGGSDANLLSGAGVICLDGLGIIGNNMHSKEEFAEIDSILPRYKLLKHIINNVI